MGERIRGRAGQALRRRRLALHPVCAGCAKLGLVVPTEFIDHILALAAGGEDVDENVQGLCALCHAIKTAEEALGSEGAANHPGWLRPAVKPLTIVCGPPCSGKSTYVADRAADRDAVIDFDAIVSRLSPGFRPWHDRLDQALFGRAIRVRNAMLGSLSVSPGRRAWFVIGAPHPLERAWWRACLGGQVVLLDVPADECIRRAVKRGTPQAQAAIARWYEESRGSWSLGKKKLGRVAFGADGYPLED